ncbi:MAG TPA: peptidylprolyl isomerase, partial [Blastocatellia bacterium]|nr:peptidylprolyl isomerase [Blastocatellia bacterium]
SIKIERKKVEPFKDATVEEMRREVLLRTNLGEMTVEMDPQLAPETVRNFLKLVESGWYDHTVFHRLVPGFVVQGGMGANRTTGPTHPADKWVHNLKPEFSKENHVRGVLSMARGMELDSANTSFFIVLGNAPHLDGKYTIFGKVTAGFDTLERIEKVPVQSERPLQHIELIEAAIKPQ